MPLTGVKEVPNNNHAQDGFAIHSDHPPRLDSLPPLSHRKRKLCRQVRDRSSSAGFNH